MESNEKKNTPDYENMTPGEITAMCEGPEFTPPPIGARIEGVDDDDLDLDPARAKPKLLIGSNDDKDARKISQALADAGVVKVHKVLGVVEELVDAKARSRVAFAPISEAHIRRIIASTVELQRIVVTKDKEEIVPTRLSRDLALLTAKAPEWSSFPALQGISPGPLLRPDGSVATAHGFDEPSGFFVDSQHGRWPDFADPPDQSTARLYADQILELVADFPWRSQADAAGWLALILTVAARAIIPGPVPMYLFTAPTMGAGKSLAADVAVRLATGRMPAHHHWPSEPAEQKKLLFAALLEGPAVLFLDNIEGRLGGRGGILENILTAEVFKDRILGASDNVEVRVDATTFVGTGNNVEITGDMGRRIVPLRLIPQTENPHLQRRTFRHPRLLEHVGDHRVELYTKALQILRAHIAAGAPEPPDGWLPLGGFTGWSDCIRGTLAWLDLPDPLASLQEVVDNDPGLNWLRRFLPILETVAPHGATAKELLNAADHHPELRELFQEIAGARAEMPTAHTLGNRLKQRKDGTAEEHMLVSSRDARRKVLVWSARRIKK